MRQLIQLPGEGETSHPPTRFLPAGHSATRAATSCSAAVALLCPRYGTPPFASHPRRQRPPGSAAPDMQWCLAAVAWGVWPSRSNVLLTTAPALISASTAAVCQFSPMTLISVVTRVHAGLQQSADNGGVPELSGVNRELKFVSLSTGPLAW